MTGATTGADDGAGSRAPAGPRRLQRRVVRTLVAGQVLGGLGNGATLSLGALLLAEVSGSTAWSGMAATTATLGAAVLAVPLARLAQARGRRVSLSTGGLLAVAGGAVVVTAAVTSALALLLLGLLLMGSGQALTLQARFAATDLAAPASRGRDLSLVVWSTTVGAVAGPNLFEPGEGLGRSLGLPPLTGGFVVSATAQAVGALVYLVGLRPDPLLTATARARARAAGAPGDVVVPRRAAGGLAVLRRTPAARRAVATLALGHAVMVALMAMTPVHLTEHGSSLAVVGLTISLHVAGMYALSPVVGALTDRVGARAVVLAGQGLLAAALLLSLVAADAHGAVTVALVLLGLGWSAATVAGSTLVTAAVGPQDRPRLQGVSDALMSLTGAAGGAVAGPVLALVGFDGLAGVLLVLVAAVVLLQRGGAAPRPRETAAATA
ncbi:MFS transporter [Pseudokineococcus lusitanus]|uniref:Putative MFS family arabinose efflux permease n=1 Tax=Pseudokineococcus lusitanus TaxID=763993 RepID=A0A3N1HKU3_9ACTN|nr:MFS transporter [Pseudokineococcus lusitanus]ROP43110.1 putative MFS family arabinose efflux permease [Pseudokineococcus lusitanus]